MSTKNMWRAGTFAVLFCVTLAFLLMYTYPDRPGRPLSKQRCPSCPHCVAKLDKDPWFAERFNQSLHPLMTRENSALSEETYKWWQSLQEEQHPANYSAVIEELFRLAPDKVAYADASPQRCRSCSVVGNSGNLMGSRYGRLIDASDFVMRINQGRTKGFEEDVGSRTTHRVMYPWSAMDVDDDTRMVLIPFRTMDLQWLVRALTTDAAHRVKFNKDTVLIYNPAFIKYVHDTWLEDHGLYPSTGFLTLVMAIHVCDEVRLFGFGANRYGNWHHYWDESYMAGTFRHPMSHDVDHERNVTLHMAENRVIQMFKGV